MWLKRKKTCKISITTKKVNIEYKKFNMFSQNSLPQVAFVFSLFLYRREREREIAICYSPIAKNSILSEYCFYLDILNFETLKQSVVLVCDIL